MISLDLPRTITLFSIGSELQILSFHWLLITSSSQLYRATETEIEEERAFFKTGASIGYAFGYMTVFTRTNDSLLERAILYIFSLLLLPAFSHCVLQHMAVRIKLLPRH